MSGIRLSSVYAISWATLASFIGAGGLGDFIFNGLNLYQPDLIIGGAISGYSNRANYGFCTF
jgi:osmoprotectant transport system permease protein